MRIIIGLLSLTLLAAAKSPFEGTWEAKINGLPGIDLSVQDSDVKISGMVTFYFQLRGEDGKWRVADKHTVPLLAPQVEGTTLAFEVAHHKTHGGDELGPNVRFRMTLTGENEARLRKVGDGPDGGAGARLTRSPIAGK